MNGDEYCPDDDSLDGNDDQLDGLKEPLQAYRSPAAAVVATRSQDDTSRTRCAAGVRSGQPTGTGSPRDPGGTGR